MAASLFLAFLTASLLGRAHQLVGDLRALDQQLNDVEI